MGYTEVNTACDLCNCYWGSPGNRACDVELTKRYLDPRIPPMCPEGRRPTWHFQHEVETIILAEIRSSGGAKAYNLSAKLKVDSRYIGQVLQSMKRRKMVWLRLGGKRPTWGEVAESIQVKRGAG